MHADLLLPFGGGDGAGTPLYCVHSASGSAYTYLPLVGALDGRRVVGIEAPGYDGDGLPPTDLRELADHYASAVMEDCGGRAACLLGWSMGGSIAYAMAWRLRELGVAVPLLVIVDALVRRTEPLPPVREILTRFAADLVAEAGGGQAEERVLAELHGWTPSAPLADAWVLLRRVGLVPEDLDAETLGRRFEVFRRNVEALYRYAPEPGYPGPLLVIGGTDSAPGPLRWADVAADVRDATVPGDHFSLWREPGLAVLRAKVREALRETAPSPAQEARA